MNPYLDIANARMDLYDRALPTRLYLDYIRLHQLDINRISDFAGILAVTRIVTFEKGQFDFANDSDPDAIDAAVIEVFDRDGETVVDLCGWPLDRPERVMTLYHRPPGIIGLWAAHNPASYFLGKPLQLYKTPLDWLKSGCENGAAVTIPAFAGRTLMDLPGRFAAEDRDHAAELDRLLRSTTQDRLVVPRGGRAAA
ncbi:hypothetical protein [Jiella sp. M17.18]|uniref:hypothetical protein n=1 Tax=Jiella sp. M17.18 TaxID=3234247 RepID=UPI0034DEBEE1